MGKEYIKQVDAAWTDRRKKMVPPKANQDGISKTDENGEAEGFADDATRLGSIVTSFTFDLIAGGFEFTLPEIHVRTPDGPVPFVFSKDNPTLGEIEDGMTIPRRIRERGENFIHFKLTGTPFVRKEKKATGLQERDPYDVSTYDDLFGGKSSNPLRFEASPSINPPVKRSLKNAGRWETRKSQVIAERKKKLASLNALLNEMHDLRGKAKRIWLPYQQYRYLADRRSIIETHLIEKMNDLAWRGASRKGGQFEDAGDVLARHFTALNDELASARLPRVDYGLESFGFLKGIVHDNAPNDTYDIVSMEPIIALVKDKLGGKHALDLGSGEKVDIEFSLEFREIFISMLRIFKSDHVSVKKRGEVMVATEHERIKNTLNALYREAMVEKLTPLVRVLALPSDEEKVLLQELAVGKYTRVDNVLETLEGEIKTRRGEKGKIISRMATLDRLLRREVTDEPQVEDRRKQRRDLYKLALKYMVGRVSPAGTGGTTAWNCPLLLEKYLRSAETILKVRLKPNLARKIRDGGVVRSITILPPDLSSGHVVANVQVGRVPAGSAAPAHPWFLALAEQGMTSPASGLPGAYRGVDINQLNCWRPNAHQILDVD